jgi:hypothetical protein
VSEAQEAANRDNADRGLSVETTICADVHPEFEHIANEDNAPDWHDAVAADPVLVGEPVDDVLVPAGSPIEIKACQPWITDSNSTRRGRWWIRRGAHDRLLEADGWYVLAVSPADAPSKVVRSGLTHARTLDELIETWLTCGDGREAARVRWNRVFDSLEVGP